MLTSEDLQARSVLSSWLRQLLFFAALVAEEALELAGQLVA